MKYTSETPYEACTKKRQAVTDPNSKRFGYLFKEERQLLDLNQAQFGQILGISPSYVSSIERGTRPVSAALLATFHECFQYPYNYLLNEEPIKYTDKVAEKLTGYGIDPRLQSLLNGCTPYEFEVCFRICQAFLMIQRSKETKETEKPV